jgi:hypothetical protein
MSHKDKKNETSFDIGNKAAEKWTLEDAKAKIIEVRDAAAKGANSLQQAVHQSNIYRTGYNYLLKKFPELEGIKEDTIDLIVDGINTKGLESVYNPTMCIWRMKQLGEKDKQEIEQTTRVIKVKTS